jgi:polar amino acid transport system substrate-binding protein
LLVGINFGNTVLVNKDANGNPRGIAVDLAIELGRRFELPLEFVTYDSAGRMAAGATTGAWDVAFLATDPDRENDILFTQPYLEIDSTYLVPEDSPFHNIDDIDREGVRIAAADKSAYDLFLTRTLKHAQLMRAPGPRASVELFFREQLDALAGIRPMLADIARTHMDVRLLEGRFAVVQQAIGTPRTRETTAARLREFVDDIKRSGFLSEVIEKNGVLGVSISTR